MWLQVGKEHIGMIRGKLCERAQSRRPFVSCVRAAQALLRTGVSNLPGLRVSPPLPPRPLCLLEGALHMKWH